MFENHYSCLVLLKSHNSVFKQMQTEVSNNIITFQNNIQEVAQIFHSIYIFRAKTLV